MSDSVFYNGGFIGKTFDFDDKDRYIIGADTITHVASTGTGQTISGTSTLDISGFGLQPGDLVIVASAADSGVANYASGYTAGQQGRPASTGYQWCYKFMGDPVDTSISGLANNSTTTHLAMAFRGVDPNTPLDVAAPDITQSSINNPDPPSITTITDGSMVVALGFLDDDRIASTVTAPSGYTLSAASQSSSAGSTVMAAYKTLSTAGTDDPGSFAGGDDDNVGATLALRPNIPYGNKKNSGIWSLDAVTNAIIARPEYTMSPSATNVNEGSSITVNVNTVNFPSGTLYWTVNGTTADFNEIFGSVNINNSTGSFQVSAIADQTTEGSENYTVSLRTDSIIGDVVDSFSLTVNDTSLAITYLLMPSWTSVNEGESVNFTVSTTNFGSGTLYWSVNGTTADFSSTSGSVTITNDSGSFSITANADQTLEGTENYTVSLRTGSTSGPNVSTSGLAVNDTSTQPSGQQEYTTPGTYSWTAPSGVTSVCVVCVGGGGGSTGTSSGGSGGGGGGLGWKNNIAVTPGNSYTVVVGNRGTSGGTGSATAGGNSYFINVSTVVGYGGSPATANTTAGAGGSYVGDGGGAGGNGGSAASTSQCGGGGGAGGYSGNGGNGATGTANNGTNGAGGGGGGGGGGGSADTAGSGGGVGLLGEGSNGSRGASTSADGRGGFGGSGGGDASQASTSTSSVSVYSTSVRSNPGLYGGGCGGSENGTGELANSGGTGAVRIIWGNNRSFPSTNTGDV